MKKILLLTTAGVALVLASCGTSGSKSADNSVEDNDSIEAAALPGSREYVLKDSVGGEEDGMSLVSFNAQVFLPENAENDSAAIATISQMMSERLNAMFDEEDSDKVNIKAYEGEPNADAMLGYYANELKRVYAETYPDTAEVKPIYSYIFSVMPVWTNNQLITYDIYNENYTGGAHGMNVDYYATYSLPQYNRIAIANLVSKDSIAGVYDKVTEKLKSLNVALTDPDNVTAALSSDAIEGVDETIDGNSYPIPAIYGDMMVFSYQPYQKAAYSEGVISIEIPLSSIKDAMISR